MAKNEHVLFYDIPSAGKNGTYHSAVITTYAIDLIHFDCHLRNTLHRKQISSISILADGNQIGRALEYASPQFLSHVGKDYTITNISANGHGVFHPKVNFFIGYDSVLMLIGSGNLTVTGHGKSHEAFTGFMIDADDTEQRPLIEECWHYITSFANQCGDFEKRRLLQEIPENCRFLNDDYGYTPHTLHDIAKDLQAALLYNEKGNSILLQIANIVPMSDVREITVVSPFFDDDGATLQNILSLCPEAKMDVMIQESCMLPPYKMNDNKNIRFYDFDETKRGKTKIKSYDRLAHAKVYVFKTKNREYCVIGSANATKAGLGTMGRRGANEELCVLYASSKKDFLKELELKHIKRCDIPCKSVESGISSDDQRQNRQAHLISAYYKDGTVRISTDGSIRKEIFVIIDDGASAKSYKVTPINGEILINDVTLGNRSAICYVINTDNVLVSNKVFVNRTDELDTTNPSPNVRELNRIIYKIDAEGYNGLEIADILSEVMWNLVEDSENKELTISHSSGISNKKKEKELPRIKYNPDFDNDEVHSSYSDKMDRASRLIDCIEESISKKLKALDDDIKDEEEEGDTQTSNNRTVSESRSIEISKNDVMFCAKKAKTILEKYQKLLWRRETICRENEGFVEKDDLAFFALSMFASIEICYLSRFLYDFDTTNRTERSHFEKILFDSLDQVMERDGVDALVKFSSFCQRHAQTTKINKDVKKKAQKAMKYMILYVTFYYHLSANIKFSEKKVVSAVKILVNLFGLPQKSELEKELEPIIESYDHAFEFRYVEKAIKKLGYNW